ncbi:hypothetical protein [Mycolicibacter kumamotonensis]|uniref:Uncharacterized protein n=1 Tax=Mycolicibacter kumamotonensis TaxID=354243 RepID=A0A1B8SL48_9MYCO|nr:hypothetical protein [Mycolicibacter kumamotonensis]OBY33413.1 hypothetical protein ACT18_00155 [Mycolicibacter kumamotonensis]
MAERMPLTGQITMALAQLRSARQQGELERELFWDNRLDHLLRIYAQLHPQGSGAGSSTERV